MGNGHLLSTLIEISGRRVAVVAGGFTRPDDTDPYEAGDLVAGDVDAGDVTAIALAVARTDGGSGEILRAGLWKSGTTLADASFTIHLYALEPTAAGGDNAAWSTDSAGYLGAIDVEVDRAFSDGAMGFGEPEVGTSIVFALASGREIYALIAAAAAYVPEAEEEFLLSLEVRQD